MAPHCTVKETTYVIRLNSPKQKEEKKKQVYSMKYYHLRKLSIMNPR